MKSYSQRQSLFCGLLAVVTSLTALSATGATPSGKPLQWQDPEMPGFQATQRASFQAAELTLTSALERLSATPKADEAKILTFLERLTTVCGHEGKYETAEQYCKLAIQYSEKVPKNAQRTQMLKLGLAHTYSKENKLSLAEIAYCNVLGEKNLAPAPRVMALTGLAEVQTKGGKYTQARANFQDAVDAQKTLVVWMPADHLRFAKCLYLDGRAAQSEMQLKQALTTDERELGPTAPQLAATLNDLAVVCSHENRNDEAEKYMRRAAAIAKQYKYIDLPVWLDNLSSILKMENKTIESAAIETEAEQHRNKVSVKAKPLSNPFTSTSFSRFRREL